MLEEVKSHCFGDAIRHIASRAKRATTSESVHIAPLIKKGVWVGIVYYYVGSISEGAMHENTEIEYLYRDASNYKFWNTIVIEGRLSRADLEPFLFDQLWFIPNRVGLPCLVPHIRNEDDHDLHEVFTINPSDAPSCDISATNLIEAMMRQSLIGWFR